MAELRFAPEGAKRCVDGAAKAKADELLGCTSERERIKLAVARYIQDVSDACKLVKNNNGDARCLDGSTVSTTLEPFILPATDPLLVEAQVIADGHRLNLSAMPTVERALQAALKRGMELAQDRQTKMLLRNAAEQGE